MIWIQTNLITSAASSIIELTSCYRGCGCCLWSGGKRWWIPCQGSPGGWAATTEALACWLQHRLALSIFSRGTLKNRTLDATIWKKQRNFVASSYLWTVNWMWPMSWDSNKYHVSLKQIPALGAKGENVTNFLTLCLIVGKTLNMMVVLANLQFQQVMTSSSYLHLAWKLEARQPIHWSCNSSLIT